MGRGRRSDDPLLVVMLTGVPWWSAPIAAVATAGFVLWLGSTGNAWGKGFAPFWYVWAALVGLIFVGGWWRGHERRRLVDTANSLADLRAMTWRNFELLVGEAYRRQGWRISERGGGGPDGGVDLELRRNGEVLLVQCKRWRDRVVHVDKIRELWGVVSHERVTGAVFVTSGTFTSDARSFVRGKRYALIDGDDLVKLLDGLRAEVTPQELPATTSSQGSTTDLELPMDTATTSCPKCGSAMQRRPGVSGRPDFWGCTRFPACRGIVPIGVTVP